MTTKPWKDPKEPDFRHTYIFNEVGRYIVNPYRTVDQVVADILHQHNGDANKSVRGLGRVVARLRRFRAACPDSKLWPMLEPYQALANQAFAQLKQIRAGKC